MRLRLCYGPTGVEGGPSEDRYGSKVEVDDGAPPHFLMVLTADDLGPEEHDAARRRALDLLHKEAAST